MQLREREESDRTCWERNEKSDRGWVVLLTHEEFPNRSSHDRNKCDRFSRNPTAQNSSIANHAS